MGVFKSLPEKERQVEESELGWAGIMSDILWNLYLQSRVFCHANETHLIRICLMGHMRNTRQLIPSLVFNRADWQRLAREPAGEHFCKTQYWFVLMVSGSQKSQISCRLFMRLFSGPIDAPRLINTSLRRCDYMLELLMGPWISKTTIKGVLTNKAGENAISDEPWCVCRFGDSFVCIPCVLSSNYSQGSNAWGLNISLCYTPFCFFIIMGHKGSCPRNQE